MWCHSSSLKGRVAAEFCSTECLNLYSELRPTYLSLKPLSWSYWSVMYMTGNTMFYYRKQSLTSHFCFVTYQPCPVAIRFGFVTARQRCKYFLWLALPEKFWSAHSLDEFSQTWSFRGLDFVVLGRRREEGEEVTEANLDVWQELEPGLNTCNGNEVGGSRGWEVAGGNQKVCLKVMLRQAADRTCCLCLYLCLHLCLCLWSMSPVTV